MKLDVDNEFILFYNIVYSDFCSQARSVSLELSIKDTLLVDIEASLSFQGL